ncbi:MAG: dipeptide/oligopeptide/nickel ABC transporter ATP-binding protein [Spirochaetaceae bacterium]|nr:dipeptide/oligopeptide/nickel ABC transporter ATP-binding protein [Spirochaetaceae bacterium]
MLTAVNVHKTYNNGINAVRGVSIAIEKGGMVGLLGESGCGKSTLARLLCCLEQCSKGAVELDGRIYNGPRLQCKDVFSRKEFHRKVQIIFQDSNGSLDPRMTVGEAVAEPLGNFSLIYRRASRKEKRRRIGEFLERVGLDAKKAQRYPHELSGGQRQRVVIARALAADPAYLICDEPVSSLDAESRDGILALLGALREETGMGCLFISHDPDISLRMCGGIHDCVPRIYRMQDGCVTETRCL